jgi:hypothetical protein
MVVAGSASKLADRILLGSVRDVLVAGHVVINPADIAVALGFIATVSIWTTASHHQQEPADTGNRKRGLMRRGFSWQAWSTGRRGPGPQTTGSSLGALSQP